MSTGVHPSALDESWFSICRLLKIYSGWQADVTHCHFLHVCMWSQTFSPSPSTHLGDLPRIVDLVMLMWCSCCQGRYLLIHTECPPLTACLCSACSYAGQVCSLVARGPPCARGWWTCTQSASQCSSSPEDK